MSFLAFTAIVGIVLLLVAIVTNLFPLADMLLPPYKSGPSRYLWGAAALSGPFLALKYVHEISPIAFYIVLFAWVPFVYAAFRIVTKRAAASKHVASVSSND